MDTLQEMFDSLLKEKITPQKAIARIIAKKLHKMGVELTDDQLMELEDQIPLDIVDTVTVNLSDEIVEQLDISEEEQSAESLLLHLSDQETEDYLKELSEKIEKLIPELIPELAEGLLEMLWEDAPAMLSNQEAWWAQVHDDVKETWGAVIDLLEMLTVIAFEAGKEFNEEFRELASQNDNYVFDALTRLHARACQIASEVLILLKAGHADGAHARWRALHEVAIVSFFITQEGQEVAERYLRHDAIESFKAAREYQEHQRTLGYDPISAEELEELEKNYDSLIERFGKSYRHTYGWASDALGNKKPTFKDIEKAVDLQHLRPYYRMASHNIHANPKGLFFKLGLKPTYRPDQLLLAGPSLSGYADPIQGTAFSLSQATFALLNIRPNIDRLVVCNILLMLRDEISVEAEATQDNLEGKDLF